MQLLPRNHNSLDRECAPAALEPVNDQLEKANEQLRLASETLQVAAHHLATLNNQLEMMHEEMERLSQEVVRLKNGSPARDAAVSMWERNAVDGAAS